MRTKLTDLKKLNLNQSKSQRELRQSPEEAIYSTSITNSHHIAIAFHYHSSTRIIYLLSGWQLIKFSFHTISTSSSSLFLAVAIYFSFHAKSHSFRANIKRCFHNNHHWLLFQLLFCAAINRLSTENKYQSQEREKKTRRIFIYWQFFILSLSLWFIALEFFSDFKEFFLWVSFVAVVALFAITIHNRCIFFCCWFSRVFWNLFHFNF